MSERGGSCHASPEVPSCVPGAMSRRRHSAEDSCCRPRPGGSRASRWRSSSSSWPTNRGSRGGSPSGLRISERCRRSPRTLEGTPAGTTDWLGLVLHLQEIDPEGQAVLTWESLARKARGAGAKLALDRLVVCARDEKSRRIALDGLGELKASTLLAEVAVRDPDPRLRARAVVLLLEGEPLLEEAALAFVAEATFDRETCKSASVRAGSSAPGPIWRWRISRWRTVSTTKKRAFGVRRSVRSSYEWSVEWRPPDRSPRWCGRLRSNVRVFSRGSPVSSNFSETSSFVANSVCRSLHTGRRPQGDAECRLPTWCSLP